MDMALLRHMVTHVREVGAYPALLDLAIAIQHATGDVPPEILLAISTMGRRLDAELGRAQDRGQEGE